MLVVDDAQAAAGGPPGVRSRTMEIASTPLAASFLNSAQEFSRRHGGPLPYRSSPRREHPLQRDVEIEGQVGLHVIVRLGAAGGRQGIWGQREQGCPPPLQNPPQNRPSGRRNNQWRSSLTQNRR